MSASFLHDVGDLVSVAGDGVVVAGGYDLPTVSKLRLTDGVVQWRYSAFDDLFVQATSDEVVVVGPQFEWLVALDTSTGEERWRSRLEDGYGATGSVVTDDALVVVTTAAREGDVRSPIVSALGLRDGELRWSTALDEGLDAQWGSPVVSGQVVIVQATPSHPGSAPSDMVYALELASGELMWSTDLGGSQGYFELAPVVADTTVVVRAAGLVGLDLATGAVRWKRSGSWPLAAAHGRVYVADESDLLILEELTGQPLGDTDLADLPDGILFTTVLGGQLIVVGVESVLALALDSGALAWRHTMRGLATDATLAADTLVVATGDQAATAIDLSETTGQAEVPHVEGMKLADAQSGLRAAGLEGKPATGPGWSDPDQSDALVVHQEPPAGTRVPSGSVIGFRTAAVTAELCDVFMQLPPRRGDAHDLAATDGYWRMLVQAQPVAPRPLDEYIHTLLDHRDDGRPVPQAPVHALDAVTIAHDACHLEGRP